MSLKVGDLVQVVNVGGSSNLKKCLGPPPFTVTSIEKHADYPLCTVSCQPPGQVLAEFKAHHPLELFEKWIEQRFEKGMYVEFLPEHLHYRFGKKYLVGFVLGDHLDLLGIGKRIHKRWVKQTLPPLEKPFEVGDFVVPKSDVQIHAPDKPLKIIRIDGKYIGLESGLFKSKYFERYIIPIAREPEETTSLDGLPKRKIKRCIESEI